MKSYCDPKVDDYRRARGMGVSLERGKWALYMDDNDVHEIAIDWTRWLDGDTISSVSYDTSGLTVSGEAESNGVTTAFLSALGADPATVDIQATTNTGRKLTQFIRVYECQDNNMDAYAS